MIKRIPTNYVLVEQDLEHNEEVELSSGAKLYVDPTFEPEKHSKIKGKVLAVPDKIYFDKIDEASMEYDVDMDVQVGDEVYFHYLSSGKAVKGRMTYEVDGKRCIFIPYDKLFFAKRGDDVIMLNGWMLVEPIEDTIDTTLVIPDTMRGHSKKIGKIKHCGSHVRKYKFYPDVCEHNITVADGDRVIFTKHSDIPVEYDLHNTLGTKVFRMQRKDIIAIITDDCPRV